MNEGHRELGRLLCLGAVAAAAAVSPVRSVAEMGDIVTTISPEPPVAEKYCAIGLAFDGQCLYFTRCDDSRIYAVSPLTGEPVLKFTSPADGSPVAYFDTAIQGLPAGIAYDAKRNGLWIGTQRTSAMSQFGQCSGLNAPVYFWDFDDDSVLQMFSLGIGETNTVTGEPFLGFCRLDGVVYVENDWTSFADDEVWVSDSVNRNIAVFRYGQGPSFDFVGGLSASAVNISLVSCTGLGIGADKLYLSNDGLGSVFHAARPPDPVTMPLPSGFQLTSGTRWEVDMECDPFTFAPTEVIWVRSSPQCNPNEAGCDGTDDVITAYEIEPGGCSSAFPLGACCDVAAGTCTDLTREQDCSAVWSQGVLCGLLDPPCFEARRIILLDRTGSMQQVVLPDGRTRCQAARDQARAEVVSFFATKPSGSNVAVWTFRGNGATELTTGFVGEAEALAALDSLIGVPCSNLTPLAEAICVAVDEIVGAFPNEPYNVREISIISDGLENNSDGPCAGPPSTMGNKCVVVNPPEDKLFDIGSWQRNVCDHMIGNGVANTTFWGELSEGRFRASDLDSETGLLVAGGVPDEVFFQALAEGTGGRYTFIDSTPPPPTGTPPFGVTGACCLPDTACQEAITEAECSVLNGMHQGDGSVCANAAGACCLPDGTCQDAVTESACAGQSGTFHGPCMRCDAHAPGACCMPNETCQDGVTPAECAAQNGTHRGGCTVCTGEPGECPAPIPAVSEWGMIALSLLVLVGGTIILGQRTRAGARVR